MKAKHKGISMFVLDVFVVAIRLIRWLNWYL